MPFFQDAETLKDGLIIFRRPDVQHNNWYCRMKIPKADKQPCFLAGGALEPARCHCRAEMDMPISSSQSSSQSMLHAVGIK